MDIYIAVTGFMAIPAKDKDNALDALRIISRGKTEREAIDYLKPYFKAWTSANYNRTNNAWLTDWAVTGTIPQTKRMSTLSGIDEKAEARKKHAEEVARMRAQYQAEIAAEKAAAAAGVMA